MNDFTIYEFSAYKNGEVQEYFLASEVLEFLAARATPAQPVQSSLREAIEAMDRAKKLPIWDNDVPHKLHVELDIIFKALCAQPSPSSVGAAIRNLKCSYDTIGYSPDKATGVAIGFRAALSEAAALAEQQGQKIAQDGRDALLLEAADFLWSAARMEQSSHDSPPEPFSEWDNDALVLSNKLRSGVKDVSLTKDALRYRHLRNLMRFSSSKLEAPTMTLSAPLDAPEHDPHTDWMAERFDESVDRTVDASIAAHNNVRETEASNGNG